MQLQPNGSMKGFGQMDTPWRDRPRGRRQEMEGEGQTPLQTAIAPSGPPPTSDDISFTPTSSGLPSGARSASSSSTPQGALDGFRISTGQVAKGMGPSPEPYDASPLAPWMTRDSSRIPDLSQGVLHPDVIRTPSSQANWQSIAGQMAQPQTPSPSSAGFQYQGPWAGFDTNSMAGGKTDRTKGNGKYYFTEVAKKYDPLRTHTDRAYAEQMLAELNQNPYNLNYRLSAENDFMVDTPGEAADYAYMGGRPQGYGSEQVAWDESGQTPWQWQWQADWTGQDPAQRGQMGALQSSLAPQFLQYLQPTQGDSSSLLAQILAALNGNAAQYR